jgi:hypothetical protein
MPFVFIFGVYSIINIYNFRKILLNRNERIKLFYKLNQYKFFLIALIIMIMIAILLWPAIEKRSKYANIQAPSFYDKDWEVIKVDDGLGEKVDDGWYGQLTSPSEILKKIIFLDYDPILIKQAKIAYYTAWNSHQPEGGKVVFAVNGEKILTGDMSYYGIYGYNELPLDLSFLKRGRNEITIRKENIPGYIYILTDSDSAKGCSWRSDDGGATWSPYVRYGSKKLSELMMRLVILKIETSLSPKMLTP